MRNDMPCVRSYGKFRILAQFLKEMKQFGMEMLNLGYESLQSRQLDLIIIA
jgi:hypothetical protein